MIDSIRDFRLKKHVVMTQSSLSGSIKVPICHVVFATRLCESPVAVSSAENGDDWIQTSSVLLNHTAPVLRPAQLRGSLHLYFILCLDIRHQNILVRNHPQRESEKEQELPPVNLTGYNPPSVPSSLLPTSWSFVVIMRFGSFTKQHSLLCCFLFLQLCTIITVKV